MCANLLIVTDRIKCAAKEDWGVLKKGTMQMKSDRSQMNRMVLKKKKRKSLCSRKQGKLLCCVLLGLQARKQPQPRTDEANEVVKKSRWSAWNTAKVGRFAPDSFAHSHKTGKISLTIYNVLGSWTQEFLCLLHWTLYCVHWLRYRHVHIDCIIALIDKQQGHVAFHSEKSSLCKHGD